MICTLLSRHLADVLDGDGAAADGSRGLDGAAAVGGDINDISSGRGGGAAGAGGGGAGEDDGAEVSEGDLAAVLLEGLDDPLGVGLAEGGGGAGEGVGDCLAGGEVLKSGNTLGLGGGVDGHLDLVADGDGEAGEAVGVVGDPLVPGVKGAVGVEGDTGLENGSLASVTVDTDPGGGGGAAGAADLGDGDGTGDVVVSGSDLDGTGPVAGVVDVLDTRGLLKGLDGLAGKSLDGRRVVAGARRARGERRVVALDELSAGSGGDNAGGGENESGELHLDW